MEINGKNPLVGLNAGVNRLDSQQTQTQRVQKPGDESVKTDSDRIELSTRGREIQQLDTLIRSTPDVREAKVEQIRGAIANGTYNVKAEKIADKMIAGNIFDQII